VARRKAYNENRKPLLFSDRVNLAVLHRRDMRHATVYLVSRTALGVILNPIVHSRLPTLKEAKFGQQSFPRNGTNDLPHVPPTPEVSGKGRARIQNTHVVQKGRTMDTIAEEVQVVGRGCEENHSNFERSSWFSIFKMKSEGKKTYNHGDLRSCWLEDTDWGTTTSNLPLLLRPKPHHNLNIPHPDVKRFDLLRLSI
jgi:hypothetical protein